MIPVQIRLGAGAGIKPIVAGAVARFFGDAVVCTAGFYVNWMVHTVAARLSGSVIGRAGDGP
jgi:hypothetical protein